MAKRKSTTSTAESRKSSAQALLKTLGQSVYSDLDEGRFPSLTLASRSVRNIVYDKKLQQFVLGATTVKKSAANVKHIRPFTQLVWLASFAKKLVEEKRTSTLRDVFYSAQAFDVEFQDQAESDELITDLEVLMQMAREGMNIYPEERSAIFGNMTIEYTVPGYEGKRADLSANPDGVMIGPALTTAEFADTDAEMVLAIEKGGLFTRFIEERVHEKHKALLINTAGQPPRSTRYLIRRLNQELGLPVGILTDSVAGDEPLLIRSGQEVSYLSVEEFANLVFAAPPTGYPEWKVPEQKFECMSVSPLTLKAEWKPVECVYRHSNEKQLLKVTLEDGRTIKVTKDHSLFSLAGGSVVSRATNEFHVGDYVMVPHRLPTVSSVGVPRYDLLEVAKEQTVIVVDNDGRIHHPGSPAANVARFIGMGADLAWIMGFWVAEGSYSHDRYVRFSQSLKNERKAKMLIQKILNAFEMKPGVSTYQKENTTEMQITISRKILRVFFERILGLKHADATSKEIPSLVWQLPDDYKVEFINGLLAGDGNESQSKHQSLYSTSSRKLAGQLSSLLFTLGYSNSVRRNRHGQFTVYIHGWGRKTNGPVLPVGSFPELFKVSGFGLFQRKQRKVTFSRLRPRLIAISAALSEIAETGRSRRGRLSYLVERGYASKKKDRYVVTRKGREAMSILQKGIVLVQGDLHPAEIVAIEQASENGVVYDLTVPNGRSFIAGIGGILLHNSDPWGVHIAMVIKNGSANSAHLRELNTPDAVWLGVRATDIIRYKLPSDKLTEIDIKRVYELKEDPRYTDKMWRDELDTFLRIKKKSEQEAFARYGLSYIVDTYLPEKLKLMKSA